MVAGGAAAMTGMWKSAVLMLALALAAVVGLREFGSSIAPEKTEAHENGVGESHGEGKAAGKEHAHDKVAKAEDSAAESGHAHGGSEGHGEEEEGLVKLTATQLQTSGIEMAPVASGTLVKEIAVPGRVSLNLDNQAKVVPKVAGTVATISKRLGEHVAKDEVLATIESREIADAKAEYLEAWRAEELARGIYEREERLWQQKVTAEQEYLNAKNAHQTAKIKLDLAHQKLHTFGLVEETIETLPKARDDASFRTYEVRSPIAGQVTARDLVLGQVVSTDKEIFTIADLSTVWVELSIQPADVAFAAVGQEVRIEAASRTASGKVVVLSPIIDPDTRAAKAIAEIDNTKKEWKLGDFVSAQLISARNEANLVVPRDAIQTIKGEKVVFVSEDGGFKARPVTTGREDSNSVEIVAGIEFGETIATKNTFALKAELGKAEAEHAH